MGDDLTRENPEQSQPVARAGLETRNRRIASPTRWPLGHAAPLTTFLSKYVK